MPEKEKKEQEAGYVIDANETDEVLEKDDPLEEALNSGQDYYYDI